MYQLDLTDLHVYIDGPVPQMYLMTMIGMVNGCLYRLLIVMSISGFWFVSHVLCDHQTAEYRAFMLMNEMYSGSDLCEFFLSLVIIKGVFPQSMHGISKMGLLYVFFLRKPQLIPQMAQ
jgi:hypothetical protein